MKTYLIRDFELRKFKAKYSTLTPANTRGVKFITKGWLSSVSEDRKTFKVIVADERPPVIISQPAQIPLAPRNPESDEQEPESRKDTLWGDLKLMTKKAIREGKHRIDHYQEVRSQSIVAPVNLTIALTDPALGQDLTPGEAYYFRLLAAPVGILRRGAIEEFGDIIVSQFDTAYPVVKSDQVSPVAPETLTGSFADFLQARFEQKLRFAVTVAGGIAACFMALAVMSTLWPSSNTERHTSDKPPLAQQKAQADSKFNELNKKRDQSLTRLQKILEGRRDIGFLVDRADVIWGGRGAPITVHEDGTWVEEKSFLALWPQSGWLSVPAGYRLAGLKQICNVWRRIWGPDQNGEVEVRVLPDSGGADQVPIGGCKGQGDAWLSKPVQQVEADQVSLTDRRPAHRRKDH